MLRSGKEYLDSIRDGRVIYIADERIEDATRHPAFCAGAQTFAALYDMKRHPDNLAVTSYEEGGERFSTHYLRPRSREDLLRRTRAHEKIADFGFGLLGRSPDAVAGSITGLSMKPEVFQAKGGFPDNVERIWQHMRRDDIFATYAVVPAQGARNPAFYETADRAPPTLRVTKEDDAGVTLSGMKMLATGAVFANEVLVGNILPLAPDRRKEAITGVIPLNLPGMSLWARKSFAREVDHEFDYPITARFDESDCVLLFKDVKVPWEKIIVHDSTELARAIYITTPAHVIANHQSTVRFRAKLRLLLGMASLITRSTGARDIPAVREVLGKLAAWEAGYAAMVDAQAHVGEPIGNGYWSFNRRYLYAAIHWAMENHSAIIDQLRDFMGGGTFQMPASVTVLRDPELKKMFEEYWSTPEQTALERLQLFKLAWDLIGSEMASRGTSYEKFFVGPAFSVRNYNFIAAPWDALHAEVETLMGTTALPPDLA